ncbi:MAG: hypothetical protein WAT66_14075 [Actinomycetota bacterium]
MDRYGHLFEGHDDDLMDRLERVYAEALTSQDVDKSAVVAIR